LLWINTELYILRGFPHLVSSVGLESLLSNNAWFSQSLMRNHHSAAAFAQVSLENRAARINWLLPLAAEGDNVLPSLLDNLSLESALRGSHCLLAAAPSDSDLFCQLRQAGFCVYSWQRIWQVQHERMAYSSTKALHFPWRRPSAEDEPAISNLRRRLLSSSVQTVIKITDKRLPDIILKSNNGEIIAMARVNGYGNKVMVTPLFAQTRYPAEQILLSLCAHMFSIYQTVYLVQLADSSAQDATLAGLSEAVFEREELLVKHFTSMQKIPLAVMNNTSRARHADTITPIMKSSSWQDHL